MARSSLPPTTPTMAATLWPGGGASGWLRRTP
jgi:hypothetical protein